MSSSGCSLRTLATHLRRRSGRAPGMPPIPSLFYSKDDGDEWGEIQHALKDGLVSTPPHFKSNVFFLKNGCFKVPWIGPNIPWIGPPPPLVVGTRHILISFFFDRPFLVDVAFALSTPRRREVRHLFRLHYEKLSKP